MDGLSLGLVFVALQTGGRVNILLQRNGVYLRMPSGNSDQDDQAGSSARGKAPEGGCGEIPQPVASLNREDRSSILDFFAR